MKHIKTAAAKTLLLSLNKKGKSIQSLYLWALYGFF